MIVCLLFLQQCAKCFYHFIFTFSGKNWQIYLNQSEILADICKIAAAESVFRFQKDDLYF